MPLFGFQTPSTEIASVTDRIDGSVYTLTERGTMSGMGCRIRTSTASQFRMGIWNMQGGIPTYLLAATSSKVFITPAMQTYEIGFAVPFSLNPDDYFLGVWVADGNAFIGETAVGGTSFIATAVYQASLTTNIAKLPTPTGPGTRKDGIWANYWLDDTLPKHNIRRSRKTSW